MRSRARLRAAVGHGKNRDSAFEPPLPPLLPQSVLFPAPTQSNPNARKQDSECCFTVVSVFGFRRFKKSLMRTPKRPT
jgi:hypothetical protein